MIRQFPQRKNEVNKQTCNNYARKVVVALVIRQSTGARRRPSPGHPRSANRWREDQPTENGPRITLPNRYVIPTPIKCYGRGPLTMNIWPGSSWYTVFSTLYLAVLKIPSKGVWIPNISYDLRWLTNHLMGKKLHIRITVPQATRGSPHPNNL